MNSKPTTLLLGLLDSELDCYLIKNNIISTLCVCVQTGSRLNLRVTFTQKVLHRMKQITSQEHIQLHNTSYKTA